VPATTGLTVAFNCVPLNAVPYVIAAGVGQVMVVGAAFTTWFNVPVLPPWLLSPE
jgi:hypothetical protein